MVLQRHEWIHVTDDGEQLITRTGILACMNSAKNRIEKYIPMSTT